MGYVAGDIQIKKLLLKSEDGCREYNLLQQAKIISVFESIMSPTVYAEIQIVDGIGLRNNFPLIGEEYVEFEFSTPNTSCTSIYYLYINEIANVTTNDTNTSETYTLRCISKEVITNSITLYNRKFKKESSEIVKDIFTDVFKDGKELNYVEPTRGIEEVIINNMYPMKAIDMIRKRATSKKYLSSSFVFFENAKGYYFTTIEGLFANNRDSIGDKVFFFDKKPNYDITAVDIRNIIAYQQVSSGNTVTKLQNGALTNVVNRLDYFTGQYTAIPYTINSANDKFQMADGVGQPGLNTTSFITKKNKKPAKQRLVPFSSERNDTQTAEKIAVLQSFIELITNDLVRIHVYGDSAVMAGDVIECKFPEVTGLTKDPKLNRLHSGKYLVSGLRHIITTGDRYNHTMALELIKGNYLDS